MLRQSMWALGVAASVLALSPNATWAADGFGNSFAHAAPGRRVSAPRGGRFAGDRDHIRHYFFYSSGF